MSKFRPLGSCQLQFLKTLWPRNDSRGFLNHPGSRHVGATTRQHDSRPVKRYPKGSGMPFQVGPGATVQFLSKAARQRPDVSIGARHIDVVATGVARKLFARPLTPSK